MSIYYPLFEKIAELTGKSLLDTELQEIIDVIPTRISDLEIAVADIEKGNKKWLELIDNLQGQIDILAGEIK